MRTTTVAPAASKRKKSRPPSPDIEDSRSCFTACIERAYEIVVQSANPTSRIVQQRTCVITGASSGIGRTTALSLAAQGARVILVCRNARLAENVAAEIAELPQAPAPRILLTDLRSLASVYETARTIERTEPRIDALINNAGVLLRSRSVTEDGYETTFAVNYLAPFALTLGLLPKLRESGGARIVNVASDVVRQFARIDFEDPQATRRYGMVRAYKQSKLALVLFTFELARRLRGTGVTANCLHPGNVETNMTVRGLLIDLIRPFLPRTTADQAGRDCSDLALSPSYAGVTGGYFERGVACSSGRRSTDEATARRLWILSEQLIAQVRERTSTEREVLRTGSAE